MKDLRLAVDPPSTDITFFEQQKIKEIIEYSKHSPRKRIIYPLHKSDGDMLHRMFNVVQPGSYIRPHQHKKANKSESIIVVQGGICFITFNKTGEITMFKNLCAQSECFGVDIEPIVIHSFFALKENTVIFEVKNGPYIKEMDKEFAEWAPEEFSNEADEYLKHLVELTGNRS
jgi:cupin fold WbuC family metalloprotein